MVTRNEAMHQQAELEEIEVEDWKSNNAVVVDGQWEDWSL